MGKLKRQSFSALARAKRSVSHRKQLKKHRKRQSEANTHESRPAATQHSLAFDFLFSVHIAALRRPMRNQRSSECS